jgi:hypothetical protein
MWRAASSDQPPAARVHPGYREVGPVSEGEPRTGSGRRPTTSVMPHVRSSNPPAPCETSHHDNRRRSTRTSGPLTWPHAPDAIVDEADSDAPAASTPGDDGTAGTPGPSGTRTREGSVCRRASAQGGRSPSSSSSPVGAGGRLIEDHGVPEPVEMGDQSAGVGLVVAAGGPVGSEVSIGLVVLEHVVGRDQHRVRHGDLGAGLPRRAVSRACWAARYLAPRIRPTEPAASTALTATALADRPGRGAVLLRRRERAPPVSSRRAGGEAHSVAFDGAGVELEERDRQREPAGACSAEQELIRPAAARRWTAP